MKEYKPSLYTARANEKYMRTIRVRNKQHIGALGRLFTIIGNAGGDIGEVRLIQESHQSTIRDITSSASGRKTIGFTRPRNSGRKY